MSVTYSTDTKTARMTAVRDKLDAGAAAGKMKLGTSGMGTVLAAVTLNDPSGTITDDVLTLSGFSKTVAASATGKIVNATLTDSDDNVKVSGLTANLNSSAAPNWAGSTVYTVGQKVNNTGNGGEQYNCTTGGTSAASGGPTGTGTGISDGSVVWDYYAPGAADISMDNLEVNSGQNVTINASPTITHAA